MSNDTSARLACIKEIPTPRLLELAHAERDGRLVVRPAKIGTRLFRVFYGEITEMRVCSMMLRCLPGGEQWVVECTPFLRFYWDEAFGKTIFLTRQEAEAAGCTPEDVFFTRGVTEDG